MDKEKIKEYLGGALQFIWLTPTFIVVGFIVLLFSFWVTDFLNDSINYEIASITIAVFLFLLFSVFPLKHFLKRGKFYFVVSILSLLAALGLIYFIIAISINESPHSGLAYRNTKRVGDIRQTQVALEIYFDKNGEYPSPIQEGVCEDAEREGGVMDVSGMLDADDRQDDRKYMYSANAISGATEYVLWTTLEGKEISVLDTDLDGNILGCNCDDPNYCVGVLE